MARTRASREEGARAALIAAASTVVFVVVAVALVVNSPNWPKVRDQFFDREAFVESWPDVLRGFWVDVQMFAYAIVAIPIVALLLASARSFRGPAFFPIRALGLTQAAALRHAILPQALRNVVPAIMNTVVSLQKDVALVSVLGRIDEKNRASP